jgi:radical SAM-linked protein
MLSFVSHLDVIRLWQRALARAEIRVEMSQGFSPRPKLGFGPPLAVGHSSQAEYFDIDVNEAISSQQLIDRLNQTLPEGIHIAHARRILPREPAVSAAIQTFVYQVTLPHRLLGPGVHEAAECAREKLTVFMDTDDVVIERSRKGRIQQIDLHKTITDIVVAQDDSAVSISMTIDLTQGAYPKPEEVLLKVFGIDPANVAQAKIRRMDATFQPATGRGRANRVL